MPSLAPMSRHTPLKSLPKCLSTIASSLFWEWLMVILLSYAQTSRESLKSLSNEKGKPLSVIPGCRVSLRGYHFFESIGLIA